MAEEDKLKGKPRTVGAAVKKGEKFFFDKKGVKKLAVTAATLKKEGKTLRQWANDFGKSSKKSKSPTTSLRPKKRPGSDVKGYKMEPVVTTIIMDSSERPDRYKSITKKPRSNSDGKANLQAYGKGYKAGKAVTDLLSGTSPMNLSGTSRPLKINTVRSKKTYTYAQWEKMTVAKRRKLGLPVKGNFRKNKVFTVSAEGK